MRRMMMKAGAFVASAAAVMLVLSGTALGGTALASTQAPHWITGPELISGVTHGRAATAQHPHIPLFLRGLVPTSDRGFVLGGGHARMHTLRTPAGKLTVRVLGRQMQTQRVNTRTCHISVTLRQQLTFVPALSTRSFTGAHGPGAYQVHFAAFFPRFSSGKHKGQCNFNAKPFSRGAVASFQAAGVLTVR